MSEITNAIDFVRRLIEAINAGRVEARTLKEMTDEQLADYHARLVDEERAEIERGKALSQE